MATPKRTGLGRGIGALIPTSDDDRSRPVDVFFPSSGASAVDASESLVAVPGARLASVLIDEIRPNAQQPRKEFDQDALEELVVSIRENGVLQPIVVRASVEGDSRYELVMGERRLRASKRAGLKTIPAVVRETSDDAMLQDALLENLHRSQLNPLEEASAYQQLLSDFGITQDQLATRIGRSRPQITNTIRLLKLPDSVQRRVASGVLSAGHARAILSLVDEGAMAELADKIVNEDLSVRAAEEAASRIAKPKKPNTVAGRRHEQLDTIGERLGDRFDTRVKVSLGANRGRITIDFASVGDLDRILRQLGDDGYEG